MSTWRWTVAAQEGLRSWRHGRWLTVAVSVLLVGGFASVAIADAVAVQRLLADERAWVAAGGRVLVATSEAGGVPRRACEALNGSAGVQGAAAVSRLPVPAALLTSPDAAVPVVTATESVADLLGLPPFGAGVVLSPVVGEALLLEAGDRLALTMPDDRQLSDGPDTVGGQDAAALPKEPVTVAAVTDLGILGDQRSTGVLVPVSADGYAEACLVKLDAGSLAAAKEALPALLPAPDGTAAIVADRLVGGEFARSYGDEYRSRGLAEAPWAAGMAAGVLWLLVRWIRRGQDGLYATLGAGWATRTVIRAVEWGVLVVTAAASALAASLVMGAALGVESGVLLVHAGRAIGIAALSATAVALLGSFVPLRSPLAALKDR